MYIARRIDSAATTPLASAGARVRTIRVAFPTATRLSRLLYGFPDQVAVPSRKSQAAHGCEEQPKDCLWQGPCSCSSELERSQSVRVDDADSSSPASTREAPLVFSGEERRAYKGRSSGVKVVRQG